MTYGAERRRFLKVAAAFVVGGALAACGGGKEQDNSQLLEYLKSELGITPTTTREELAEIAFNRAIDPTWFLNKPIGTFKNINGDSLELSTDEIGELSVKMDDLIFVKYPIPTVQDKKIYTFQHNGVENQLIIYGTLGTISRSESYKERNIEEFLNQFFGGSKSPINIIHLDFNQVKTGPAFSAATSLNYDKETDEINYPTQEVIIRFNRAHSFAKNLGMSLESIIRFGLTNESVGFLGNQYPKTANDLIREPVNESYSTLAALASALDPSV